MQYIIDDNDAGHIRSVLRQHAEMIDQRIHLSEQTLGALKRDEDPDATEEAIELADLNEERDNLQRLMEIFPAPEEEQLVAR